MTNIANRSENACFIFCRCDPCDRYPCSSVINHIYKLDEDEENDMAMVRKINEEFVRELREVGEYIIRNAEKLIGPGIGEYDAMEIVIVLLEHQIPIVRVVREFDIFDTHSDEYDYSRKVRDVGEYLVKNAESIIGNIEFLRDAEIRVNIYGNGGTFLRFEKNMISDTKRINL